MNTGVGTEHREVLDLHVVSKITEWSDDGTRSDLAVVADMSVVNDEIIVTEPSTSSSL
jgi:hypothetical protein